MDFNFRDLDEVKQESIQFKFGSPLKYIPLCRSASQWEPEKIFLEQWQRCYSTKNGILAYVEGDTVYVIPCLSNVEDIVKSASKFQTESSFFVPLSKNEELEDFKLNSKFSFLKMLQRELLKRDIWISSEKDRT